MTRKSSRRRTSARGPKRPNAPSTRAELVAGFGVSIGHFKQSMDSDESRTMVSEFAFGAEYKGAAFHAMGEGGFTDRDVVRAYEEAVKAEAGARRRLISLIDKAP